MSRNKFLMIILAFVLAGIFVSTFIFVKSRALQKDTCKKTIEDSFSVLLRQDNTKSQLFKSDWVKLDLSDRSKLLKYASENVYTECGEFPYLIAGSESDGSKLNIYVRRTKSEDSIELLLDK